MSLGTNYRRNVGKEDAAIARRISNAIELANKELGGDIGLGASIVLGRMTIEEAREAARLPSPPETVAGND